MRVELPYRCWQVPSSFSSGRRCKSFQRAERQSKHWLQMEGRVTIFSLLLFSRALRLCFSLISHRSPCCFISFAFAGRPSSLRLSGGTCNHVFRIRGYGTLSPSSFSKGRTNGPRGRVENDLDDNFISSYCQHVSAIRLSAIVYRGRSMFHTLPRSVLISASETELSIYLSTAFLVNARKLAIKTDSHELFA